jgi:hypothetical protein
LLRLPRELRDQIYGYVVPNYIISVDCADGVSTSVSSKYDVTTKLKPALVKASAASSTSVPIQSEHSPVPRT